MEEALVDGAAVAAGVGVFVGRVGGATGGGVDVGDGTGGGVDVGGGGGDGGSGSGVDDDVGM